MGYNSSDEDGGELGWTNSHVGSAIARLFPQRLAIDFATIWYLKKLIITSKYNERVIVAILW